MRCRNYFSPSIDHTRSVNELDNENLETVQDQGRPSCRPSGRRSPEVGPGPADEPTYTDHPISVESVKSVVFQMAMPSQFGLLGGGLFLYNGRMTKISAINPCLVTHANFRGPQRVPSGCHAARTATTGSIIDLSYYQSGIAKISSVAAPRPKQLYVEWTRKETKSITGPF